MEVLNNKISSPHRGNRACIHQNLFKSPKHNKIMLVKMVGEREKDYLDKMNMQTEMYAVIFQGTYNRSPNIKHQPTSREGGK